MSRRPDSILSDSQCTRGESRGACSCGHSEGQHGEIDGCRGLACLECPCGDFDPACPCGLGEPHARRDVHTLTLPGVGGLTDAELHQALSDPARDVEASAELARRGVDVLRAMASAPPIEGRDFTVMPARAVKP